MLKKFSMNYVEILETFRRRIRQNLEKIQKNGFFGLHVKSKPQFTEMKKKIKDILQTILEEI